MIKQDERVLQVKKVIKPVTAGALILLIGFLGFITTLSADDYWYGSFLNNDLKAYFDLLVEHYNTFNGRVLVHIFAQIILHFGNWLFAVFSLAIMIGIPFCAARFHSNEEKYSLSDKAVAVAVFAAGVLALPREFYVMGIMWTSAFCNYVLPIIMIVGQIYFLRRMRDGKLNIKYCVFLCVYCFLCGATTEQAGAVAVVIAVCACVEALINRRAILVPGILAALSSAAGLVTIFLSPATTKRYDKEVNVGLTNLVAIIKEGLISEAAYCIGNTRLLTLFVLFFIVGGVFLLVIKRSKMGFFLSCLLAAFILSTGIAGTEIRLLSFAAVLLGVFVYSVILIFRTEYQEMGYYLIAGLVSAGVILFTNSIAERTLLPFYIYVLVSIAAMLMVIVKRHPKFDLAIVFAAAVIGAVCIAPDIPGYWYNHQIENENIKYAEEARETGALYINIDYDHDYTHSKMCDRGYYLDKYLEYLGIEADFENIHFQSAVSEVVTGIGAPARDDGQNIRADDKTLIFLAFFIDDECYLPFRTVIEYYGGEIDYTSEITVITFDKNEYYLQNRTLTYIDDNGETRSIDVGDEFKDDSRYFSLRIFVDVFDLDCTVKQDMKQIYITRRPA